MGKARYLLETAVWKYNAAFSLRDLVHTYAASPTFLRALNNPDDPRYRITFLKGGISVSYRENPGERGQ